MRWLPLAATLFLELLGDVAADLDQWAAAGTAPIVLGQIVDDRYAGQMTGG